MFTRFGQIFWGLLLVILDLTINGFDVLPDFVGYLLIAIGCGGLTAASREFSTAQGLSWILVALSLIGFIVPRDFAPLFDLVHLSVNCAMMWFLLGGVMEFAAARERPDLSERASNRRIAYLILMSVMTLTGVVAQGSREAATLMVVVGVICMMVLLVLILHLIFRVRHELATNYSA